MSPIRALFWKEWRQLQWRFIFSLIVCGVFVFVGLKTRVMQDEMIICFSYVLCAFLMPLFVAMALVAEERELGCLPMQLKLPAAAWKVYIVKMAIGTLTAAMPAIVCLAVTLIMAGNREMTSAKIFHIYGFCIPFEILFMLWTVVFSIKRRTQWASALTGVALMVVWVLIITFEELFLRNIEHDLRAIGVFSGLYQFTTPLGFLEAGWDNGPWIAPLISQSIIAVILFFWGLRRFSMLTRSGK